MPDFQTWDADIDQSSAPRNKQKAQPKLCLFPCITPYESSSQLAGGPLKLLLLEWGSRMWISCMPGRNT
jgi:hypothetical protein